MSRFEAGIGGSYEDPYTPPCCDDCSKDCDPNKPCSTLLEFYKKQAENMPTQKPPEDDNVKPCSKCRVDTSFERDNESQPKEGEVCMECGEWFCSDCIDWVKSDPDPICKECAESA